MVSAISMFTIRSILGISKLGLLALAAFTVVAGTLLIQGLSLPWLVRWLRLPGPDAAEDALLSGDVLRWGALEGLGAAGGALRCLGLLLRRLLPARLGRGRVVPGIAALSVFSDRHSPLQRHTRTDQ